jgi:hypothetical protein
MMRSRLKTRGCQDKYVSVHVIAHCLACSPWDDRFACRDGKPAANDILEFDRHKSRRAARVRALGGLGAVGIQLAIDAILSR